MPALITTLYVIGGSLLIASPIGIFTAIYLVEYADRDKLIVKVISMAIDTLAAVPSMVYGLFGFFFFLTFFGFKFSFLSGFMIIRILFFLLFFVSVKEALIFVVFI